MTDVPPDFFDRPLAEVDPEIADVLSSELSRQQDTLDWIRRLELGLRQISISSLHATLATVIAEFSRI